MRIFLEKIQSLPLEFLNISQFGEWKRRVDTLHTDLCIRPADGIGVALLHMVISTHDIAYMLERHKQEIVLL